MLRRPTSSHTAGLVYHCQVWFKSGGFCGNFPALVVMRFMSTSKDGVAAAEGRSSCSVRGRRLQKI